MQSAPLSEKYPETEHDEAARAWWASRRQVPLTQEQWNAVRLFGKVAHRT